MESKEFFFSEAITGETFEEKSNKASTTSEVNSAQLRDWLISANLYLSALQMSRRGNDKKIELIEPEDVPLCLVKNPQEHHKVEASAASTSEFVVVTATKRGSSSRRKSCVPKKRPKLQTEETTSISSSTCTHLPTETSQATVASVEQDEAEKFLDSVKLNATNARSVLSTLLTTSQPRHHCQLYDHMIERAQLCVTRHGSVRAVAKRLVRERRYHESVVTAAIGCQLLLSSDLEGGGEGSVAIGEAADLVRSWQLMLVALRHAMSGETHDKRQFVSFVLRQQKHVQRRLGRELRRLCQYMTCVFMYDVGLVCESGSISASLLNQRVIGEQAPHTALFFYHHASCLLRINKPQQACDELANALQCLRSCPGDFPSSYAGNKRRLEAEIVRKLNLAKRFLLVTS